MIHLFKKDETNFDSNGLGVLDSEIKENVVEEKMNGIYNFDFAYLSKGKHASQLEGDMIIKAPTPDGDQLFRVYKVTKNIGFLEVNCYHIFYDLAGNFIEDINIVSQSGQAAITHFGTGLQYATRFKFVSNIVGTNSARMVRLNAVQALLDSSQDNSFLSRWGGEIKRNNFTVYMNDVRGNDKGFKIRHGKNLTGYEANIDYSTVVTRIMPYGYNGLMLPEKYVDSPLRDKYAFTRIKKIEYTNIKAIDPDATSNDEDAVPLKEAYELLRQAAALEYSVNKVDIPTSNFKVTFKNLADTKEYADFKALEKVEPWDYVTVIADNLDIKSRMISYKYDAITQAYKEVELGNYVPSFSDTNTETNNKLSNINNDLNNINNDLNTVAETANGKNSNYYGSAEPNHPVDGDLWYKKNGDKTELWQYDGKSVPPGWKLIVDDATGEEIRQNVDTAQKEAEEAKNQANKAVDGANQAVAKAGFANDTADQAKSDAATALTDAKNALTNSSSAQADSAQARKDSATAIKDAADSLTSAKDAISKVGTLTTSVTSQFTTVNNELKSKVNQTDYDKLKGTVTTQQTEINQNASGIKLKADKSYADTINNSVVKNTSSVGLLNNQIALTVSKAELNNTLKPYATQTWTQSQIKSTADQINLSVSKVQNNLDNLQIDGINLLANSDRQFMGTGSGPEFLKIDFNLNDIFDKYGADRDYTVSFDLSSKDPSQVNYILSYAYPGATLQNKYNFNQVKHENVTTTPKRYTRIIHPTLQDASIKKTTLVFYGEYDSGNVPIVNRIKITLGNAGNNAWSPAPEDQATVDWTKSQLDITDKKITAGITTVTNTLNNTIASATANMATTTWTNTQIDAAKTAINLSVEQSITTSENTLNSNIDNATKDMATQTWTQGQINTTADNINLSVSKVQTDLGGTKTQFAALEVKVDGITTTVSGKADKSQITQLAGQITSVVGDVSANSSQITQMKADINLRVKAGNVVNQINISPEGILIDGKKVHITGLTRIDNAVIKDAMIEDIKADKITAGTLNAANVNVINLNANNITTGTIKGANLSLNLNTGEVLFQKGAIRSTNGNLNIHIDDGSMSLTNSLGNGAYFKDGNIYMTDSDFWTPGNPKIQYGTLKMVPNFMSDAGGGVALKGPNGVVVGTDEYSDTGIFGDLLSSPSGGGITLTKEHIRMASEGDIGIAGGKMYNSGFVGELPAIQVGIAGSHTEPRAWLPSNKTGDALFLSGEVVGVVADGGTGDFLSKNTSDLSVAGDARSGYVLSTAAYKRTYGSGDTVTITPNGVFGRISSASKYKLAIGEISTLNDEAHQFLSVKPKQWFDKSESEALADSMTTGNTDYVDDAKALPHNGFIAEDLYTAGLDSYVIRGNDGSIESIQYDRLPVLHHELIRELFNRLDAAEMEIYKLKQEANNAS